MAPQFNTQRLKDISNRHPKVSKRKLSGYYLEELLECGDSVKRRQRKGQELLDYLCETFDIPKVTFMVVDEPQRHTLNKQGRLQRKVLGLYYYNSRRIKIWNKTAMQKKIVSIRVFSETVLHEFIHHYDVCYLGLRTSYHTEGFYNRLEDIKTKLNFR